MLRWKDGAPIFGAKGITRRGVLAAGTAAAAMPGLMTGRARAANTPKRGGHFVLALGHGNTADTLNPATWENQFTNCLAHAMHGRLTEIAANGDLVGEVAETWEHSSDAKTWRFILRQGLTFHNGQSVRPDDVAASLNYHRDPDVASAAQPLLKDITDLTVDTDGITIRLLNGNADFPFLLADGHLVVVPSSEGKIDPNAEIGCGAYRLDRFDPGVVAKFSRYEGYWDDNRGFFDSVEIRASVDPAGRQAALLTGEVHAIDRVPLDTFELLRQAPGVAVMEVAGTQHFTFPMQCDVAPFNDPEVRRALKCALDRQDLLARILRGHGTVGNDSPITPANRYYNDEMPAAEYDPDRARHHLKKAGYDRLSLTLSVADAAFQGAVDAAALYRENAAAAGIDITVDRVPSDGYWTNVWRNRPWCASYWGGRTTEDSMFSEVYQSGVPWNESDWSNERFDALLLQARAETDVSTRRTLYFEMQDIVRRDGGSVIPLYANYVFARRDSVATPAEIGSNWTLDGSRCIERWWFA
ncbi:MAG: ABC transporter substrate-binding protein [Alphaproteobacteria bacterium]|nr:ABC transporter substrate-binding protein [Alphaproteobacteria bacterium]